MGTVLVGVITRDRPEALEKCLASLEHSGGKSRVVIHLDAPDDPGVAEVAEESGYEVLVSKRRVGMGGGVNKLLRLRERNQDFFRFDGDTEIITPNWLAILDEEARQGRHGVICPVLKMWNGRYAHRYPPSLRTYCPPHRGAGIGAAMLIRSWVLNTLGDFREGVPWSFEDTDYYVRMQQMGWAPAMAGRVLAREITAPVKMDTWRHALGRVPIDPAYERERKGFHAEIDQYRQGIGLRKGPGDPIIPPKLLQAQAQAAWLARSAENRWGP